MSGKSVKTLRKRFLTIFHPDDKTAWKAFKKNARGEDVQVQHDTEKQDGLLEQYNGMEKQTGGRNV